MDQKKLKIFLDTAEEFGEIAKKVKESSKLRRTHAENAIKLINKSLDIGDILNKEIKTISKANSNLRNQDNIVLNTCIILKSNMNKQKIIIKELIKEESMDQEIGKALINNINTLIADIEEALSTIRKIIQTDNDIILMDNLILMRKKFQNNSIKKLKRLALKSLRDAGKAIKGSSSNLVRGHQMVEHFKKVEQLVKDENIKKLEKLVDEAKKGWNIAVNVNKSSTSQLEFAEKVNMFTQKIYQDSNIIRDFVVKKHQIFRKNLENITVLTVLLALQFKSYLEASETAKNIDIQEDISEKTRNLLNDLIAYIKIACNDINQVAELNYDMTDTIQLNAELEIKSVELTNKELQYYDNVKQEVYSMTEATRYPIEGSSKNITNGQILERELNEVIDNMK